MKRTAHLRSIAALIATLIGLQAHAAVIKTYSANTELPPVKLKQVMITAFAWSNMDDQNSTIAAASRLRANLEYNGAHVRVCFLPVIYDLAAEMAMNCFLTLNARPDIVISLGESGAAPGVLQIMTEAANLDNVSVPDDRGDVRLNAVIDRSLPPVFNLRVPLARLTPMIKSGEIKPTPHETNGYICNHTAFRLGHEMQSRKIPYMFVHIASLPEHGYDANDDLDESVGVQSGDVLTKMLSLLTTSQSSSPSSSQVPLRPRN